MPAILSFQATRQKKNRMELSQGSGNFFISVPKNLSWKVCGKSRRAKSEVPWLRRNRASEPCPRPTKSRWFDRGTLRPRRKNYAGGVLRLRTRRFSIKSTWFCGPWTGLGRSISPQPRHFGLCPPGFPTNFSRRICFGNRLIKSARFSVKAPLAWFCFHL